MKKIIILLIITSGFVLAGCAHTEEATLPTDGKKEVNLDKAAPLSKTQDGIEVVVENILRQDNKTIIELTLNNHQYDLSEMDIKKFSSFNSSKPTDYAVKSLGMGGHHVEAEIVFDGELFGDLVIGLNENLEFSFIIL